MVLYRNIFIYILLTFSTATVWAQFEAKYDSPKADNNLPQWAIEMYKENPDVGIVVDLYQEYYNEHDFIKNQHTQYYKRFIKSISREVIHSAKNNKTNSGTRMQNWTCIGPWDWDHDAAARSYAPGSAHVYVVEQSISNPDVLYAGTATSGIYKTTDRGNTWVPLTYQMDVNSVYALEIDHSNPNIVYAAMLSTVMKSTDGGVSWINTGDAAFQNINLNVKDIMMSPANTQHIIVAAEQGLYRTTNGGNTWTLVESGHHLEIEFHPTNSDIVYSVSRDADNTYFKRSLNAGANFSTIGNGWPSGSDHQRRTEIAISPDDPDYVFAHATGQANGGSGLYGIYVSSDQGNNWTFQCCGPQPAGAPDLPSGNINIMAWAKDGSDNGGQFYYDVAFGVSPFNADSLWAAGVNLWVSGDRGVSMECKAKWSEPHLPEYVHADLHDFHYYEHTGEIWIGCDGGIFMSDDNGQSFTKKVFGIEGSDFWGFDAGWWEGDVMLGGAYHNGTLLKEDNVYINDWLCTDGGDGNFGRVNPGRARNVHSWFNIKDLKSDRTISPSTRSNPYEANASYITGEDSDILFHPHYYDTWWVGSGNAIYKTKDNGYTFEMLHDFGVRVVSMDISPSDPNILYACTWPGWWDKKFIYKSTDGGSTWSDITVPEGQLIDRYWIPYDVVADPIDANIVTVVRTSMYNDPQDGRKLYQSTDGGQTWNNISGTAMDGFSPTNINSYQGTKGGLVIGTRKNVFYKDDSMSDFIELTGGLPVSTNSEKIVPYYRKKKIRNATNRSIWEFDMNALDGQIATHQVIARPALNRDTFYCSGDTLYFKDLSVVTENNDTYTWILPGSTLGEYNEKNPKVVYDCAGSFDVKLIVSDEFGIDSITVSNMVNISSDCLEEDPYTSLVTSNSGDYVNVSDVDWNISEMTITAWVKPDGIQTDYSGIVISDGTTAGFNFKNGNNSLAYHWPGGSWSWNSGLIVPSGEWSHVAMVATPSGMTLYVNGVPAHHNTQLNNVNWSSFRIGSYKGWASRNFYGEIEEVCIYDRALSTEEIRLGRHLTKDIQSDPNLLAYYKFNREDLAFDEGNQYHGNYNAGATTTTSYAPVGLGVSDITRIKQNGVYNFPNSGVDIDLTNGLTPNGEIVVSHIVTQPTLPASADPSLFKGYYIINNYGTNQIFDPIGSLYFSDAGTISNYMVNNVSPLAYIRDENEGDGGWTAENYAPYTLNPGIYGGVLMDGTTSITSFGKQYALFRDKFPVSQPSVVIKTDDTATDKIIGGNSAELALISDNSGFVLPSLNESQIAGILNPIEGGIVFNSDNNKVLYYNGTEWRNLTFKPDLTDFVNEETPENVGVDIGGAVGSLSVLDLQNGGGLVLLPTYTNMEIPNIETPTDVMLLYNSDLKAIQIYNNSYWISLDHKASGITPLNPQPLVVEGMAIGQSGKNPQANIEISNNNFKTLALPKLERSSIQSPKAGLLIFDGDQILLYNGETWNAPKTEN